MDLADRKIIGWSLSENMTTENTVLKAWICARRTRAINAECIFHSDRGVQYASNKITALFSFNRKITQSMSRKGNCWINTKIGGSNFNNYVSFTKNLKKIFWI